MDNWKIPDKAVLNRWLVIHISCLQRVVNRVECFCIQSCSARALSLKNTFCSRRNRVVLHAPIVALACRRRSDLHVLTGLVAMRICIGSFWLILYWFSWRYKWVEIQASVYRNVVFTRSIYLALCFFCRPVFAFTLLLQYKRDLMTAIIVVQWYSQHSRCIRSGNLVLVFCVRTLKDGSAILWIDRAMV